MTPWAPLDLVDDKPREECGVFGVYRPPAAAGEGAPDPGALGQLGLFALQHRGQESCGICVTDGSEVRIEKGMGLVTQVFTAERLAKLALPGARIGVAHTRYSTTGSSLLFNAQPLTLRSNKGVLALSHNGTCTSARGLRDAMREAGAVLQTRSASEGRRKPSARYSRLDLGRARGMAMTAL